MTRTAALRSQDYADRRPRYQTVEQREAHNAGSRRYRERMRALALSMEQKAATDTAFRAPCPTDVRCKVYVEPPGRLALALLGHVFR